MWLLSTLSVPVHWFDVCVCAWLKFTAMTQCVQQQRSCVPCDGEKRSIVMPFFHLLVISFDFIQRSFDVFIPHLLAFIPTCVRIFLSNRCVFSLSKLCNIDDNIQIIKVLNSFKSIGLYKMSQNPNQSQNKKEKQLVHQFYIPRILNIIMYN